MGACCQESIAANSYGKQLGDEGTELILAKQKDLEKAIIFTKHLSDKIMVK